MTHGKRGGQGAEKKREEMRENGKKQFAFPDLSDRVTVALNTEMVFPNICG